MKRRWLWLLLPLGLGALLSLVFARGGLVNPTVYLRADLAALALFCGVGAALLLAGWYFVVETARSARQDAEAQAAEDRRRFLQRLDHEMKNPLTAMQAGLANLGELPEPETLESVKAQTLRLSRLVADLRKLSDLETRPIDFATVDLAETLETVVSLAQDNPKSEGIRMTLSLPQAPWPLPRVSGDGDLLLLAFHNLLDNAVKFCQSGDTIEVRGSEDGSMVLVEVADTGPGIPEQELPHIWQELYRGERARGVSGSGLGLALVMAIVERHHGRINIRSRLEEGTVITIRLPQAGLDPRR